MKRVHYEVRVLGLGRGYWLRTLLEAKEFLAKCRTDDVVRHIVRVTVEDVPLRKGKKK